METIHGYITTDGGNLVAELEGVKAYELDSCIRDCGFYFGDTFEVEADREDDIWTVIDRIYEKYAA